MNTLVEREPLSEAESDQYILNDRLKKLAELELQADPEFLESVKDAPLPVKLLAIMRHIHSKNEPIN